MNYAKNYFGKENISDITYDDLIHYFSQEKEESDKIEYKSFDTTETKDPKEKERGILRAICALLNSEGGVVIWGAPIGKKQEGKKEKIFTGDLSLVETLYEKDQFINKITDSISPAPRGVLFHRIEKDKKYVYIFETPQSEYAPHQFADKFFMRMDGQTKPAPYHYIEALFKKIRYPNLQGFLKLDVLNFDKRENAYNLRITPHFFNFSQLQNDYNLAFRIACDKGTFHGSQSFNMNKNLRYINGGHEVIRENVKDVIHNGDLIAESFNLVFNPQDLQNANWEVTIIVTFGAKYSPMKQSYYKIRLASFIDAAKINDCITEKKENQFMFEISEKTDAQKIEGKIGRKI